MQPITKCLFKATPVFETCWDAINKKVEFNRKDPLTGIVSIGWKRAYKLFEQVGGSRSSKTWSNFQIIYLYCKENKNKTVIVLRDTASDCRDKVETEWRQWLQDPHLRVNQFERGEITIEELDLFLNEENLAKDIIENKSLHSWTFPNGCIITFTGVDDENKAIGKSADIVWVNEPYKFPEEVFKQLRIRCKDFMLWDWNPKQGHYIERFRVEPDTFVHRSNLTMNPFCPEASRREILAFQPVKYSEAVTLEILTEAQARQYDCELNPLNLSKKQVKELLRCRLNEENNSSSDFDWLVYGLGHKAEKPNRVFKFIKIPRKKYDDLDSVEYIGCDWGKNHNWGILSAKFYDGALYLRELNYKSEIDTMKELPLDVLTDLKKQEKEGENLGIVSWMFSKLGISKKQTIICDNNRPLKIAMLRRCGWDYAYPAQKGQGSIKDGIDIVDSITVYYTEDSPNIEMEQEMYSYPTDRYGVVLDEPEDTYNHLLDPVRYICQHLVKLGLIKVV